MLRTLIGAIVVVIGITLMTYACTVTGEPLKPTPIEETTEEETTVQEETTVEETTEITIPVEETTVQEETIDLPVTGGIDIF